MRQDRFDAGHHGGVRGRFDWPDDIVVAVVIIDLLARYPELTRRERQVCAGILRGLNVKEIGRELGCSFRTVEDHKTAIYKKLGVRTGDFCVAMGIYSPPALVCLVIGRFWEWLTQPSATVRRLRKEGKL